MPICEPKNQIPIRIYRKFQSFLINKRQTLQFILLPLSNFHKLIIFIRKLLIKKRIHNHRERSVKQIKNLRQILIIQILPGKQIKNPEPKIRHAIILILKKIVQHHIRIFPITLSPPVKQQPLQKLKLADRKIRGLRRLLPLNPSDPDPHMRLSYHRHVVRAVPNRQRNHILNLHFRADFNPKKLTSSRPPASASGRPCTRSQTSSTPRTYKTNPKTPGSNG